MLCKYKPKKITPKPNKESQKKQKSSVCWAKFEIQLIIDWFCIWNKKSIKVNYDVWTTRNHLDITNKILSQTKLYVKVEVIKKVLNKLVDMIK